MRIENEVKLDFQDVLIRPRYSTLQTRSQVSLYREFKFLYGNSWRGRPIISSNMISVTNEKTARILASYGMLACFPKTYSHTFSFDEENFIPSVGFEEDIPKSSKFLCIDVANGYLQRMLDRISYVREKFPKSVIIAGNVVTPEMTERLIKVGADIVKVGLGSGSACLTRIKTGVGIPQLSAVIECAEAAHGCGAHIISDGGCTSPGDVVKAFAAGADFVMLGGMLAGHIENGNKFFGMSSRFANENFFGGLKNYRTEEGLELRLPSKGALKDTINDILGGIRSACTYTGASDLEDLPAQVTFIRVNRQANTFLWEYADVDKGS